MKPMIFDRSVFSDDSKGFTVATTPTTNSKMTITNDSTKPLHIDKKHKLYKYYSQRYNLFSKYDLGIQMDEESWYSVTPENIAHHIAKRVERSLGYGYYLVVDGFCGVGGNLIQFARSSPFVRVIGCDINPNRIKMAKHNAKIYGVEDRCEFILGDFMQIMETLQPKKVDAVFLSPPWGGIEYQDMSKYSLSSMTPDGFEVVHACRKYLTDNIAFLMPRNIDLAEVKKKLLNKRHLMFECEQNMVGKKVKTITAYFGELVDHSLDSDSEEGAGIV